MAMTNNTTTSSSEGTNTSIKPGKKNRKTYYYLHDHNKNVVGMIDKKGNRVATYEYDPYGEITHQSGPMAEENPIRYSSEFYNSNTGLVEYLYRHYNPKDGRWLQRDPITERGGNNLYGFVRANPITSVDRFGLQSSKCSDVTITIRHERRVRTSTGTYGTMTIEAPQNVQKCCPTPKPNITMELPPGAHPQRPSGGNYSGLLHGGDSPVKLKPGSGTSPNKMYGESGAGQLAKNYQQPYGLSGPEMSSAMNSGINLSNHGSINIHGGNNPKSSGGCILVGPELVDTDIDLIGKDIYPPEKPGKNSPEKKVPTKGFDPTGSADSQIELTAYLKCVEKNFKGAKVNYTRSPNVGGGTYPPLNGNDPFLGASRQPLHGATPGTGDLTRLAPTGQHGIIWPAR